jgi:NitT/TauT family transport system permease protein
VTAVYLAVPEPGTAREKSRLPVASVAAVIVVFGLIVGIWYAAAIYYNTGYLALLRSETGQLGAWNHLGLLRQWGQALNSQAPELPAPHQVLSNLWTRLTQGPSVPGNLWVDILTTTAETVPGFVVGSLVASVLAYLFVSSRILELSLFPYVVMSQTVPIIALVPAMVVILGIGFTSKVVVAAYLAFYPVTVSAVKGLRSVNPLSEELMRSYAASGRQRLLKLKLPSALPFIFTGLKIGVTASLIGAIVSELPAGSQFGLGVAILSASANGLYINLWATIVAAGILGLILFGGVTLTERLVTRRSSARE